MKRTYFLILSIITLMLLKAYCCLSLNTLGFFFSVFVYFKHSKMKQYYLAYFNNYKYFLMAKEIKVYGCTINYNPPY